MGLLDKSSRTLGAEKVAEKESSGQRFLEWTLILDSSGSGLDHGVGHLVLMTTEKRLTEYREGLQLRSYLAILSPSTSHMVGASAGEVACGNDNPRQAPWQA